MNGITVISATNRENSQTKKVALAYLELLKEAGVQTLFLSLEQLPHDFLFTDLYGKRTSDFELIIREQIEPNHKFIFVVPEYNGSFPGILKGFLDAIPPRLWTNKKAALVGVAQGRAGNLRGIEQLTLILNYLKVNVFYHKIPISGIDHILESNGSLVHEDTVKVLKAQIQGFLAF